MASQNPANISGDLNVGGRFTCGAFEAPNDSVGNSAFRSDEPLDAVKQEHQYGPLYTQKKGVAVAADSTIFYVPIAKGSWVQIVAGLIVPSTGDSVITIDIKKNGTTILNAAFTITSAQAAYDRVVASINPSVATVNYDGTEVFEVIVTVTLGTGTLGQGLFVKGEVREASF